MKRPLLIIGLLCAVLILTLLVAALVMRQRPPQSTTDINRGFPGVSAPAGQGAARPPFPSVTVTPRPPAPAGSTSAPGTLYIEPDAGFNWLYDLIGGAQHTLDMTMYELVDPTASAALVAACTRGVRVRVILDSRLELRSNTPVYDQLNNAGPNCSASWANPQFQATHEKSMVIDNTLAAVMTFNLTSRYYLGTRDLALVTSDPADVTAIEGTFTTDLGATGDFSYQPAAGDDLIWSPTTAQAALVGLITGAKATLLVENEELGAAVIVNALADACRRGVVVSLAMTDTSTNYHANYTTLEGAGCGVHIGADTASTLYIHAKAMVADLGTADQVGYLGSINFSVASMTRNRELGLYLHDANLLQAIAGAVRTDYASFPAYQP